jgi:hypothetical protein
LTVSGINDSGAIVGTAAAAVFQPQRGVLLVPKPAPPTNVLFQVTGRVVTVQWAGIRGALEYIVEAGSAPGTADVFNGSVGLQTAVTALAAPGRYYVRVRTRNALALSAASTELVIHVP